MKLETKQRNLILQAIKFCFNSEKYELEAILNEKLGSESKKIKNIGKLQLEDIDRFNNVFV